MGSTRLVFGPRISQVRFHTRLADPVISGRQLRSPVDCRSTLFSRLSPEWQIVDLATSLYGKTLVPLYENFGPDSIGG